MTYVPQLWTPASFPRPNGWVGGKIVGALLDDVTNDQTIVLRSPGIRYAKVGNMQAFNCTGNAATLQGGLYSAIAKGGTPLLVAVTTFNLLTAAGGHMNAGGVQSPGNMLDFGSPIGTISVYLNFTVSGGGGLTADFEVGLVPFC